MYLISVVAFHRALPVDQRRRIDEAGIRQMLDSEAKAAAENQ
jgi:hypothetical protein